MPRKKADPLATYKKKRDFAKTEEPEGKVGSRGKARGPRKATLAKGRKGRFKPLTCGASCSAPSIEWKERGIVYRIAANVGTKRTERKLLVRMANQAIRRGPR